MTFRYSIRLRIVTGFCLFGALLGSVYAAAVYVSLELIDDRLIDQRLAQEMEAFSTRLGAGLQGPFPRTSQLKAYVGAEGMPQALKTAVGGLKEGFHEIRLAGDEYHVAVGSLPGRTLYLVYDVSALEFTEKRRMPILLVLLGGVILVTIMGFWVGLLISRKIIAPVIYLAEQVDRVGRSDGVPQFAKRFYHDEVGTLARALEQAMLRIKAFVEREQQFARDASHELRTPVTVIKGALEILERKNPHSGQGRRRPIQRIQRAVNDMERIIASLLWLSREEAKENTEKPCAVIPVVREVLGQFKELYAGKPLEVTFSAAADPRPRAPAAMVHIAVANLVRNAFHYTPSGRIEVTLHPDRLVVTDTGPGPVPSLSSPVEDRSPLAKSESGFGLGLAIVTRLGERFGWRLELHGRSGGGTEARLIFNP